MLIYSKLHAKKSYDSLFKIIYQWQFLSRFSILREKWRVTNYATLLDENLIWQVNSSVKIHLLSPRHVWKLSASFIACEKQSLFAFEFKNLTTMRKQKKTSLWFWCGLLQNCFSSCLTLCRIQVYLREETLQPAQVARAKMTRNEAKIYQETDFLSIEWHLVTLSGLKLCYFPWYLSHLFSTS